MIEVAEGRTEEWFVEPGEFGLAAAELDDVAGGTPEENAAASQAVLDGEHGPRRDLVVLNAGAAIYVGGLASSLGQGVEKAETAIDDGQAAALLERLVATIGRSRPGDRLGFLPSSGNDRAAHLRGAGRGGPASPGDSAGGPRIEAARPWPRPARSARPWSVPASR